MNSPPSTIALVMVFVIIFLGLSFLGLFAQVYEAACVFVLLLAR